MDEGEGNRSRSLRGALGALNFSMADMQAGIGPFPGVLPVRILDGIGAGLQSVAVQGVGASLSPAIGGWIVHFLGCHVAFLILGGVSLGSVALWLGAAKVMTPACAGRPDARPQPKIA